MSDRVAPASLILASPALRTRTRALRPALLAALLVVVAWALAIAAAVRWPEARGLASEIERAALGASDRLGRLATVLQAGYSFSVGMVAAVNPCGFALLPAYLALFVGTADGQRAPLGSQLVRAIGVGALLTLGFVALFGLAGALLTLASVAVGGALAWFGVAIGTALVATGGILLGGGRLPGGPGQHLAGRLGGLVRRSGALGFFAYGLAYGLASLGCALPLFLGTVGTALATEGPQAALRQYLLYALGMGSVVTALTLLTAVARQGLVSVAWRAGRWFTPLSAILLTLAGFYVIHYWLVNGLLPLALRGS